MYVSDGRDMAIEFASLGSGSSGNATIVRTANACVLVDCGFSLTELQRRAAKLGVHLTDLDALFVTHEHSDHIKGAGVLSRKLQLPIYMTPATHLARPLQSLTSVVYFNDYQPVTIKDLEIRPVPIPHDAADPVGYVFCNQDTRVGVLTDLGSFTDRIVEAYAGCHGLLLEANHDLEMLARGPYSYFLKQRVGGRWGHLNNHQAKSFIQSLDTNCLQQLVLAHISAKNNTPAKVLETFSFCPPSHRLELASQTDGSRWFSVPLCDATPAPLMLDVASQSG